MGVNRRIIMQKRLTKKKYKIILKIYIYNILNGKL